MLKFSASVLSGETPVNEGDSLVTLMFQRRDFSLQYHLVADSTVETLIAQDAQLYLGHIQAVYWSVMELQALGDASCFGWLEGIVCEC